MRNGNAKTDLVIAVLCVAAIAWARWDGGGSVFSPPPIQVEGPHGVIFEETGNRDADLATVLLSKAVEDATAGYKEWRQFDENEVSELWRPVLEQAKAREDFSLPWMVLINGSKWTQGPMPLVKNGEKIDVAPSIEKTAAQIEEYK